MSKRHTIILGSDDDGYFMEVEGNKISNFAFCCKDGFMYYCPDGNPGGDKCVAWPSKVFHFPCIPGVNKCTS